MKPRVVKVRQEKPRGWSASVPPLDDEAGVGAVG